MSERPLLLLDTATLYYRAFHGLPSAITAPDGTPSGAVRGTLDSLAVIVERLRPSQVIACWDDDWRPAWRTELLPSYKAHRVRSGDPGGAEDAPEGLEVQVQGLVDVLAALALPRVGAHGAEADDIAATLAAAASFTGREVVVVSGDRDLFQVILDGPASLDSPAGPAHRGGVRVLWIGRGVRQAEIIDSAALAHRTGLGGAALEREGGVGAAYADLAVLRGDPSDGLPGVAGIGEKTAATLLTRYGSLESILGAATEEAAGARAPSAGVLGATQRRRLEAAADYLARAPQVVAVRRDVEVTLPPPPPRGLRAAVDEAALARAAQRWGVQGPVERLLAAMDTADAG